MRKEHGAGLGGLFGYIGFIRLFVFFWVVHLVIDYSYFAGTCGLFELSILVVESFRKSEKPSIQLLFWWLTTQKG